MAAPPSCLRGRIALRGSSPHERRVSIFGRLQTPRPGATSGEQGLALCDRSVGLAFPGSGRVVGLLKTIHLDEQSASRRRDLLVQLLGSVASASWSVASVPQNHDPSPALQFCPVCTCIREGLLGWPFAMRYAMFRRDVDSC